MWGYTRRKKIELEVFIGRLVQEYGKILVEEIKGNIGLQVLIIYYKLLIWTKQYKIIIKNNVNKGGGEFNG